MSVYHWLSKRGLLKIDTLVYLTRLSGKSISSNAPRNDSGPLEGVKVLDLTRIVAGPYCTMILGDYGAEIIKIERPGSGDEARKWGPPFIERNNTKESCYFVCLNRNKKSICIDIKSDKGRDLIYQLSTKCDVLVENYVPGKLDQLKLGYNDISKVSPHLVYCSITGYGSKGPYKNRPGYDVIAASIGGLLHITGPQNGEPVKVGVAATDMATGLYAHGAIMAALIQRMKTGKGKRIECNLLSTQVAGLINVGSNYLNANIEGKRHGTAHESIVPYQAFATKDGFFTIGIGSDKHFADLCRRIQRTDLIANAKFDTNKNRVANREEIVRILNDIFCKMSKKEMADLFSDSSFPCGPVNTLQETFDDPHIKYIDIVKTMQHPQLGPIKIVGPPVTYGNEETPIRYPSPLLGEHTNEILSSLLNLNDSELVNLRKSNTIQ